MINAKIKIATPVTIEALMAKLENLQNKLSVKPLTQASNSKKTVTKKKALKIPFTGS